MVQYDTIERNSFIYMQSEKDLMKFYRRLMDVLDDLEFDTVKEHGVTMYLTSVPKVNPSITCTKEKDPYTDIEVEIRFRFKSPQARNRPTPETFKVELWFEGEVVTEYPDDTAFQRSFISSIFQKLVDFLIYRKEKKKYWEECEELVLEISDRAREIYESLPSIGKSRREYYQPDFR